jgi:hypothetical protein
MNRDELVEAIIKEVKRVLALRGISVSSSASSAPVTSSPSPVSPAAKGVQSVGSTDLTGKQIITQKDLEAFKGQTITVTKRAVITPLAFDYAREKKIILSRIEQTAANKSSSAGKQSVVTVGLTVAPDFPGDSTVVKKFLASKGFTIKDFSGKSHETAINNLCTAVSSGSSDFGISIEKTGMEGPIYANRNRNIRAVHCRETMDARAARVDIGANVIVIDSTSNPEAVISGFVGY